MEIEKTEVLAGVKFSAGLLVVGGSFVGLSALAGLVITIALMLRRRGGLHLYATDIFFFLYLLVYVLFAFACFRIASGLYQLRRSSRYSGVGIGLFLLVFGICLLLAAYFPSHPERSTGDESYAVLMSPFLIGSGAWLAVYLNLPRVYRQFTKLPGGNFHPGGTGE
jgi:cytochrome bd-type quinol oxidase subunit 2